MSLFLCHWEEQKQRTCTKSPVTPTQQWHPSLHLSLLWKCFWRRLTLRLQITSHHLLPRATLTLSLVSPSSLSRRSRSSTSTQVISSFFKNKPFSLPSSNHPSSLLQRVYPCYLRFCYPTYLWNSGQQGFGSLISKPVIKVTNHLRLAKSHDQFSVPCRLSCQ